MLDELRDRIISFTSKNRICVISASSPSGAWAMPARHQPIGIGMVCWLPRWSEVLYYLEEDPRVMLVILDTRSDGLCWLQYRGTARVIAPADLEQMIPSGVSEEWTDDRYAAIHITPLRIDMIDESLGWGARETLDV